MNKEILVLSDGISGFLRAKDLTNVLGVSRSTLWRLERTGVLPQRVAITGSRAVGWRVSEINDFIKSRESVQ